MKIVKLDLKYKITNNFLNGVESWNKWGKRKTNNLEIVKIEYSNRKKYLILTQNTVHLHPTTITNFFLKF